MTKTWMLENDEEGLAGEPCQQWLIRDVSSDNDDIIAVVTKTGDEQYDNDVVYPQALLLSRAPQLKETLEAVLARIHGEFDNPSLAAKGPLFVKDTDIASWCEEVLRGL